MSKTKITIVLLAGMAAGAALGLLFAPQTGTETRNNLADSLTNLGDTIKETAATQIDAWASTFNTRVIGVVKSKISGSEAEAADDLEHA